MQIIKTRNPARVVELAGGSDPRVVGETETHWIVDAAGVDQAALDAVDYTPPPAPVPEEVSSAAAIIALSRAGLLEAVKAAVAAAEAAGNVETRLWFDRAQTWRRDHPVVASLGQAVELTAAEIDDLFRAAAAL